MALVVKDRVQETTTTTGTGTVTLAGAVSGFQSFSVIGDGNTTYYAITSGTDFEVGLGTYTASGTTLSRDTVLESSNSGNKITLAGTSNVFVTYPAEKSLHLDASDALETLTINNTTTGDSLDITTTEDSSTAGPVINLKRNSASPADGDYLGQIKFKGENDADQEVVYAKITGKISDVTDTTEDGLIEFTVKENGGNTIVARLTSTALKLINTTNLEVDGSVTATSVVVTGSPAFHAYPSATTSANHSVWTKVPINTERFDLTSDFNTSTYRFTPSVEGYYSVTGMISFGENIASVEAGLSFNGSIAYGGTANWSNNVNSMTTALIYFNGSTDYVELYAIQWSGATKTIQNTSSNVRFEAHLVREV